MAGGIWSGPGIVDANSGLFDPDGAGVGIAEIYYASSNHCQEDFVLLVKVVEPPEIDFVADKSEGCPPLGMDLMITSKCFTKASYILCGLDMSSKNT